MADNIKIDNLEAGADGAVAVEEVATTDIEQARQSVSTAFSALASLNPDLGTHFINELTASFDAIYDFLHGAIYKSAHDYFKKEDVDDNSTSAPPGGNGGRPPGGGGGGGSQTTTPPETTPDTTTPETTAPVVGSPDDINIKPLEQMELSDLVGFMIELKKLADISKKSLEEYIADDANSEAIKKVILESPYVPKELIEAITNTDSKIVRQLIVNILNGKYPEIFALDDINKAVIVQYLEGVAERKEMTYEELLKDEKALKETMAELEDAVDLVKGWDKLTDEQFREEIKSFYHGDVADEIPDQDIYVARAFVDYSAVECGAKADELLEGDKDYATILKEGAKRFGKALEFFKTTSLFSSKTMSSMVTATLKDSTIKRSKTTLVANSDSVSNTTTSTITDGNGATIQNMYVG